MLKLKPIDLPLEIEQKNQQHYLCANLAEDFSLSMSSLPAVYKNDTRCIAASITKQYKYAHQEVPHIFVLKNCALKDKFRGRYLTFFQCCFNVRPVQVS